MKGERPAPEGSAPPPRRGPGLRERLAGVAMERGADLLSRAESTLVVRCLRRFAAINGRDRSLVLGGQAFTAIIPLLIVVAAAASGKGPTALADRLAARFHVTGVSAQAIRTLFERPPGATGTFTIVGVVVLLFSVLNLTRSLQRTYEAAWQLPAIGVRGTLNGVTAVGLLISSLLVLSLLVGMLRQVPAGTLFAVVLRVVMSTGIWLLLQFLLLSRRIPFRRLLPGSIVAGAGGALLNLYSAVWMPRVIENNSGRYGIIGITFALLTWLILVCVCVVVAAVIGAEMGGAPAPGGHRGPAVSSGRADEVPPRPDDDAL
ncbi:YhjD/YihY/BrkB family envelope integrity protein [Actinoplanes sp. NPDC049118]|uniref:YhjD/YihY/BrkB family envelope integrity protein n=1 Tax=Actinoplanes sp. NPDC049118 TaxID=3155769 RepID=UPI0033F3B311